MASLEQAKAAGLWCDYHDEMLPCPKCSKENRNVTSEAQQIAKREKEKEENPEVHFTGRSIEDSQLKGKTINDMRDDIVEAAVEYAVAERNRQEQEGTDALAKLVDSVDVYHTELRKWHRENKP